MYGICTYIGVVVEGSMYIGMRQSYDSPMGRVWGPPQVPGPLLHAEGPPIR